MKLYKFLLSILCILPCFKITAKHHDIEAIKARFEHSQKISKAARDKIEKLGIFFEKTKNMNFIDHGAGLIIGSTKSSYEMYLLAPQSWTIDEARPVIVDMLNQFLNLIYYDESVLADIKLGHELMPKAYSGRPDPILIGFKIGFWDQNVERPLPPKVAQIRVVENKIYYYQANPKDQSLQEPFTETIEEAFARVGRPLPQPPALKSDVQN